MEAMRSETLGRRCTVLPQEPALGTILRAGRAPCDVGGLLYWNPVALNAKAPRAGFREASRAVQGPSTAELPAAHLGERALDVLVMLNPRGSMQLGRREDEASCPRAPGGMPTAASRVIGERAAHEKAAILRRVGRALEVDVPAQIRVEVAHDRQATSRGVDCQEKTLRATTS